MDEPRSSADPPPPPPQVSSEIRQKAESAWSFGIAAMGLAMIAPCGSYVTLLAALPLGILAMTRARDLLEGTTPLDEGSEITARHARLTGLLAALWSGVLIALLLAVICLYLGLFAVIFALVPQPPPPPTSP